MTPIEPAFSDEELIALLRDESVSAQAIAEEMEGAGVDPEPVEALELARRLLRFSPQDYEQFSGCSERLRRVVLDEAVAARAVEFITAAAGSKDKAVAKEAKRALHRLRQAGLKVEPPKPSAPPVSGPASPAEVAPNAWMSVPDGTGGRFIFHPCPVRGGIDVAHVFLSDEEGIVTAELLPLARRGFRKFAENLAEARSLLLGEVPRAYTRSLIARALDRNVASRRSVPPGFNEVSLALGPVPAPVLSPGRSLPPPDGSAALEQRVQDLLSTRELRTWQPPEDVRRPLLQRLDEIAVSTIVVDDAQRDELARAAVRDAIASFWTEERRRLWAERLFDAAWLLEGPRREAALAAAVALEGDAPVESVAFCRIFFERLLPKPVAPAGTLPEPVL